MPPSTCLMRVLFAGFHPLILEDSRLQAGKEYEIHTSSADEGTLLPAIDRLRPNFVVLDLLQTGSLRTIQRVRDTDPSCRVVALTGLRRANITESIISAGASGVLYRSNAASELFIAIREVRSGQRYLSPIFTKFASDAAGERSRSSIQLSASDEVVLRLIGEDYPAHRIARSLGLSPSVVRRFIAYLKQQLNRRTIRDLKRYAATHEFASNSVMRLSGNIPRDAMGCRRKGQSVPQELLPAPEGTARGRLSLMSNGTGHHLLRSRGR